MVQQVRKWVVQLTGEQRRELSRIERSQKASALIVKRARILLLSDDSHPEGRRTDEQIAELVGLTRRQVQRIRMKLVQQGLEATLKRKVRADIPSHNAQRPVAFQISSSQFSLSAIRHASRRWRGNG